MVEAAPTVNALCRKQMIGFLLIVQPAVQIS